MPSDDEDEPSLKINPTLRLDISLSLRLANRPYQRHRVEIPRDIPLLVWILRALERGESAEGPDVELEISESVLERAVATGVLVTDDALPPDALAFRCALDPPLLELAPASDRIEAEVVAKSDVELVLNPRRWVQTSTELSDPLKGRVVIDASLRDRAGHPELGPFEGAPRELGPLAPEGRLWVEHPATEVLQPIELDPHSVEVLDRLESGALAPRDLPPATLELLLLSDVVVPAPLARRDQLEERRAQIRDQLARDKYLVVRNAVSPLFVAAMRRHFRAFEVAGHLMTDKHQVKDQRDGLYCELITLYLQDQLGRWLNAIAPRPVQSTFCWFSRYRSGAVLKRHRDRPQCLWNLSFAVDGDPDPGRDGAWPLWFEIGGEARSVRLGLGDAVLYSGTELPHWRDELPQGRTAGMCFMHYVDLSFQGDLG
jgi:hypothetical protein